jgi:hypothetical protein
VTKCRTSGRRPGLICRASVLGPAIVPLPPRMSSGCCGGESLPVWQTSLGPLSTGGKQCCRHKILIRDKSDPRPLVT